VSECVAGHVHSIMWRSSGELNWFVCMPEGTVDSWGFTMAGRRPVERLLLRYFYSLLSKMISCFLFGNELTFGFLLLFDLQITYLSFMIDSNNSPLFTIDRFSNWQQW